MSWFDVDDLTNKIDVGSQPGTLWSLSSEKPGHGLAELRDPSYKKLWQSDGLLPHFINIQFAERTAVTHVSIYLNFAEDDSYTPNKIRIMAGTHYHDLVEVRKRELKEPSGWKHFVLDKFDNVNESDEQESSAASSSDDDSDDGFASGSSSVDGQTRLRNDSSTKRSTKSTGHQLHRRPSVYLPLGVSLRHTPIYAYLLQVSVTSNHASGKDSHIRGIRIFGPPTRASRRQAKREARKAAVAAEASTVDDKGRPTQANAHGASTGHDHEHSTLMRQRDAQRQREAHRRLQQWIMGDDEQDGHASTTRASDRSANRSLGHGQDEGGPLDDDEHDEDRGGPVSDQDRRNDVQLADMPILVSRRLHLQSSLR